MAGEEKGNYKLYELDGCLIVPFHEDTNPVNIPVLMGEALKMMERSGLVHVILDLSSVVVIDRKTFRKILELANMIRMMGGGAVFTGIQPGVASALVDLAVDTERVVAVSSIGEGIRLFRDSGKSAGAEND